MKRIAVICLIAATAGVSRETHAQGSKNVLMMGKRAVGYDEFGEQTSANCLILLHGASGPSTAFYRDQAMFFGDHGFHVVLPHYFDSTHSSMPTIENYRAWANAVSNFVGQCRQISEVRKIYLIGYSLGGSVALVAGSQGVAVDAIAEWYGSLPDEFFYQMKGLPPLLILHGERDAEIPIINGQQLVKLCAVKQLYCDHHFYSDQAHGFTGDALKDADQRTLHFFASL